jgi:hypothetical protein
MLGVLCAVERGLASASAKITVSGKAIPVAMRALRLRLRRVGTSAVRSGGLSVIASTLLIST